MNIELHDQTITGEQMLGWLPAIVELRDGALQAGRMDYALMLSLLHAVVKHVAELPA